MSLARPTRVETFEAPAYARVADPPGKESSLYLQTLGRGLDILELLAGGPLLLTEIEDRTGLNRAAVYRLVRTLECHDMVRRDESTGHVQLTPRLWQLGVIAVGLPEIRTAASRMVRELRAAYGETVHLSVYSEGGEVVYIDKADGLHPIGSYTTLGGRAPAAAVATGKALLAWQPIAEIARVLSKGLVSYTPRTVTDPAAFQNQLAEIRERGYAENTGEWRLGVGGFGASIFDHSHEAIAAIGFSGPADRLLERRQELVDALLAAARSIDGRP